MKSLKEFLNFISRHEIDSNVVWKMLSMSRVCIGECYTVITKFLDTTKSSYL